MREIILVSIVDGNACDFVRSDSCPEIMLSGIMLLPRVTTSPTASNFPAPSVGQVGAQRGIRIGTDRDGECRQRGWPKLVS